LGTTPYHTPRAALHGWLGLVPGYAELNEFVPAGDEVLTLDVAGATSWEPMEFGSNGN